MPTYISLINVRDHEFQNVQELAALWGDIRNELKRFDVSIEASYTVLGAYDFLIIITTPDRDSAFQAALTIQGHGLDLQTMEVVPTDHFGELVDDI